MRWLEHDEVTRDALPDWARADGGRRFDAGRGALTICPDGLVLEARRRASAVPWEDVLTTVRVGSPPRLLVAVPRRPPRPPWFEIAAPTPDAVEGAIAHGLAARVGYRSSGKEREALSPDEVLTRVLAHDPVPGAVEIPRPRRAPLFSLLAGTSAAAAAALVAIPYGVLAVAGAAVLGCAGTSVVALYESGRLGNRPRVLVLTPDAFVAGLDGGPVRAVPWRQIAKFRAGRLTGGAHALEVVRADGRVVARVHAGFFGEPLDVIVPIAEAYGRRARSLGH